MLNAVIELLFHGVVGKSIEYLYRHFCVVHQLGYILKAAIFPIVHLEYVKFKCLG